MRIAWLGLVLALAVSLPDMATAQRRGESSRGLNGAVEKLFEHRDELGISSDQIAKVEEIKAAADTLKRPLWQQIMTVRREVKERRRAQPDMPEAEKSALLRQSGERIERLLDQIKEIDHSAMRDVGAVLSPQQKERIREMISKNRGDGDRSDDPRGRGDRGD